MQGLGDFAQRCSSNSHDRVQIEKSVTVHALAASIKALTEMYTDWTQKQGHKDKENRGNNL